MKMTFSEVKLNLAKDKKSSRVTPASEFEKHKNEKTGELMGFLHLIQSISEHLKIQMDENMRKNLELTGNYSSKSAPNASFFRRLNRR